MPHSVLQKGLARNVDNCRHRIILSITSTIDNTEAIDRNAEVDWLQLNPNYQTRMAAPTPSKVSHTWILNRHVKGPSLFRNCFCIHLEYLEEGFPMQAQYLVHYTIHSLSRLAADLFFLLIVLIHFDVMNGYSRKWLPDSLILYLSIFIECLEFCF